MENKTIRLRNGTSVKVNQNYIRHLHDTQKRRRRKRKDDACTMERNLCRNPDVLHKPSRLFMPQIGTLTLRNKLDKLIPVKHANIKVPFHRLVVTQREISYKRAQSIVEARMSKRKSWNQIINNGMIVCASLSPRSRRVSVIDGHHRWLAIHMLVQNGILSKKFPVAVHMYYADPEYVLLFANSNGFNEKRESF